jgi:DNA-3-methyladenine glycosylase II
MGDDQFSVVPDAPYDLANQNRYFGGWPILAPDDPAIVISFPVEGWRSSAAVAVRQDESGRVTGEVRGAGPDAEAAWRQACAALSLDFDGRGWAEVGKRDPVIGALQGSLRCLRPLLFHSPYEAAASFVIGHRISMRQARKIRQNLAERHGEAVEIGDRPFPAFPRPQALKDLPVVPGLSETKVHRLRGIAAAALEGLLDRDYLRSLPVDAALERLRALEGIGEFFSQGILHRGAGLVDEVTDDVMTKRAVQAAYRLGDMPDQYKVLEIAEPWRPYRTWAMVLLHVWFRREGGPGAGR